MKVFSWEDIITQPNSPCGDYFIGSAIAIGGFDGPHLGHKALCLRVLEKAAKKNLQSGIITFAHSPRLHKEKTDYAGDISTLRLRLDVFKEWGFDFVVVIDFSEDFSKIEGTAFLRVLTEQCAMRFLTVGEGFRCGFKHATGTAEIEFFANENNIRFVLAPLIAVASHRISSSIVRQCILLGKLKKTAELLGRPFMLDCQVLDWLTLSCKNQDNKLGCIDVMVDRFQVTQILPPDGTYCVNVLMQNNKGEFSSLLHLDQSNLRLEVPEAYKNERLDTLSF